MNTNAIFNLGIDLAQTSFEAALAPERPDTEAWRDLPHVAIDARPESRKGIAQLQAWITETIPCGKVVRIVVESTGVISKRFALALMSEHGLPEVAIVNPRRTKAYGESLGMREKTDRIDAAMIALYAAERRPRPQKPRSAAQEHIRSLSRLRTRYSEEQTMWKNRLHSALDEEERKFIKQTIGHIEKQIARLEARGEEAVREDPDLSAQVKHLKRIPGYGKILAMTLTAECGLLAGYSRGQIVAVNGVFPKHFDSGKSVHRAPRLAKGGGGRVRRVLFMAALSLFSSQSPFHDQIDDLQARGLAKKCIIGILMRKLLLVGRAVVKNGGDYKPAMLYRQTT